MHRHIAEMAVSLVVNHRVTRQVALMYVAGVWVLMSTEDKGSHFEGSHIMIDASEAYEVAARLDDQAAEWRDAGHRVLTHVRHVEAADVT